MNVQHWTAGALHQLNSVTQAAIHHNSASFVMNTPRTSALARFGRAERTARTQSGYAEVIKSLLSCPASASSVRRVVEHAQVYDNSF
ncbi:MAG: hypothetical protein ACK4NM_18475, partial [Hydrogenophaga sp.]